MPITLDGTLGITTPALTVTGATVNTGGISTAGNLTFTSTGQRITGDMTNGTLSNRLAFQTSTANSSTNLHIIPSGTSTSSGLKLEGDASIANGSRFTFDLVGGTDNRIGSGIYGTGTYLPITFYNGGSERMRIDTSGNVGIGITTPSTYGKLVVSSSAASNSTVTDLSLQANRSYSTSNNGLALTFTASNGTLGSHDFGAITFNEAPITNGASAYVNMYLGGASSAFGNASRYLQAYNPDGLGVNYIAFWSSATERMRIDSSGNVGIGTSSPAANTRLYVSGGRTVLAANSETYSLCLQYTTAGVGQYYVGATNSATPDLVFSNVGGVERMRLDTSGNLGIGITPSNWNTFKVIESGLAGNSFFGQTGAAQVGVGFNSYYNSGWKYANGGQPATLYYQLAGVHTFVGTNITGSAGGAISYSQLLAFSNTKTVALEGASSVTGTGISFPATQSASTDANTLDDYEEGTWTPAIAFNGNAVGLTYSARFGRYTKTGRIVVAQFYILLSAKGSSAGGMTIGGLPFAAYNGAGQPCAAGVLVNEAGGTSWPLGTYVLAWSDSNLYCRYNNGGGFTNITDGNCTNTLAVYGTITYEAT